jgi:hypothetical protein
MPTLTEECVQEFYGTFRRDAAAFEEQLPRMLEEFPGEYVAILDGEIIDHRTKWEELFKATRERYPDRFVFLEHVVPKSKVSVDMDTLEG